MGYYLATPLLPLQPAAGAAFASFTTKQDISPQPLPVMRAGSVLVGTKVWVHAAGEYLAAYSLTALEDSGASGGKFAGKRRGGGSGRPCFGILETCSAITWRINFRRRGTGWWWRRS